MLTRLRSSAIALLAVTVLAGCLDDPTYPTDPAEFHPDLNIDLAEMTELQTGLYILDTTGGGGATATDTSTIRVHYRGWLKNGQLFDTNRVGTTYPPIEFKLGQEIVIEGWELGLPGMREGAVRKLVIPPHLAYGNQAIGPIHPNATLVFEVELVEVVGAPDTQE